MEDFQRSYKESFAIILEPMKAMLVNLEGTLPREEWLKFVDKTRLSIINKPEQYLGLDIPDPMSLGIIVSEIFNEFILETSSTFVE
jgi:hypothetical protein